MKEFLKTGNGESFSTGDIVQFELNEFRSAVLEEVNSGSRVSAFFAADTADGQKQLVAVLLDPVQKTLKIGAAPVGDSYEALTPECKAFHYFEREIMENNGIMPVGHPWLKPVRTTEAEFYRMEGDALNEVAVGPVHAGVIEPGHFRFQCMGEKVYNLEIVLGYQHRGVEELLKGPYNSATMPRFETAAGDSAAAAAYGAARAFESLCGMKTTEKAEMLRTLAIELERVANHTGDLGALAGDVAFLPTASFCGRIRGDYLNMSAVLCGNRFGRNFIVPGGTRYDVDKARAMQIKNHLQKVNDELKHALDLMFTSPTSLDRFENTGHVSPETASAIGLVGPAARSCGMLADVRRDLPCGYYKSLTIPEIRQNGGDVLSRAQQRYDEIFFSLEIIDRILNELPTGDAPAIKASTGLALPADRCVVSVTEAWRGELCQVIMTGNDGSIKQCKIVDPSFHNWYGLSMALRGEEISNFPICNKSFNLSYCGHDL